MCMQRQRQRRRQSEGCRRSLNEQEERFAAARKQANMRCEQEERLASHYYNEEYKVGKQVVNVFGGAVQRAPHVERRSKCKKRNCSDKNVERSGCFNCNNAPIRKFFSFYPDNAHNTPTHTPHIETYFYTHARTYHFAFI